MSTLISAPEEKDRLVFQKSTDCFAYKNLENFESFPRPTKFYKTENPESIALQWIPGDFLPDFRGRGSLILYRYIDCQGTGRSTDYRNAKAWTRENIGFVADFGNPP